MKEIRLPTRAEMLDTLGRPITQSLFLELGYSSSAAYTLKEVDHEYEGRIYPSIKRLYLEMEDPTEYEFATKYFLNWKHWERICANVAIFQHVREWREELDHKIRASATKKMIDLARSDNYQAVKWLADKGWAVKGAGRPSKDQLKKDKIQEEAIIDEYGADVVRMYRGA